MISRPTGPEPVKAIVCTPGWRDERGAGVALAGQQRERVGRDAGLAQGAHDHEPAARRLLGRLEDDAVARGQAGGRHAHGDRDREVPRRDDRHDAARRVAHLVALAGDLEERLAAVERDGAAGVELEEVDGLADVGVGLVPGLGALADRQRGELGAALAHPGRGARRGSRRAWWRGSATSAGSRAWRSAPPRRPRRSVAAALSGDDAVGRAGIVRGQLFGVALAVADPHRDAQGELGLERWPCPASSSSRTRRAAQLADRLVDEGRQVGHGAASSSSSERPAACSCRKDSLLVFSSSRRTR